MEIASLEGARTEILKTLKDSSDDIDRVIQEKQGKKRNIKKIKMKNV